ncbi:MAG: sodium:proton antiporter [Eggerthellaceae bacterium]|nr:sodium:proton antiporter [Eggerthellaceae bacterium]
MSTFTVFLVLVAAVLVSSVLDQVLPRVSLPLIQIALGIVIAIVAGNSFEITLDPDLFMVLFIAPLLYDEAKTIDKAALWHNIRPVLSLAIGLVLLTMLIVGFTLKLLEPSIELAAAFVLGAALGPTDAVAVNSLSNQISIPQRQKYILKGELLLNDASGIVSFQFAMSAIVTASFSLLDATEDFLIEFFGGILFGLVLGFLGNWIIRKIRSIGIENTTFHVLFEVFIPFIIYLVSDACGVSGVIAVVTAGLLNVASPHTSGASVSRMNIVSTSVWRVLSFGLNGIVFVLLGTQLPKAMSHTWEDVSISNVTLIIFIFVITFIMYAVRFLWIFIMDAYHIRRKYQRHMRKRDVKNALVSTLCGAKGTVTLSIMFSIPIYAYYDYDLVSAVPFPNRDLLIFLACGVIVVTMLVATFIVPLLCPAPKQTESEAEAHQKDVEADMEILRMVISELTERQTPETQLNTSIVIQSYNQRIDSIKNKNDFENEPNVDLRIQAIDWEREKTQELMDKDIVHRQVGYRYLDHLDKTESLLGKRVHKRSIWRVLHRWFQRMGQRLLGSIAKILPNSSIPGLTDEYQELQVMTAHYVVSILESKIRDSTHVPTEDASELLIEYQQFIRAHQTERPTVEKALNTRDQTTQVRRLGLLLELEFIQEKFEEGELSRNGARQLRENVNLMLLDLDDQV